MSEKILLVEDDANIQNLNRRALLRHGYHVVEAGTFSEGKALAQSESPDLIILDIMLPDGNGLELCEQLRAGSNVPILFLSAKSEKAEIVEGLEAGGDDYLAKPYDLNELLARVKVLLRKAGSMPKIITKGSLTLRLNSNQAFVNGVDIGLSHSIEFSLLRIFVQEENRVLSAEYLYEEVWGQPMAGSEAAIRTAVSAVRKKLDGSGYTIDTVYGKGYRFERG